MPEKLLGKEEQRVMVERGSIKKKKKKLGLHMDYYGQKEGWRIQGKSNTKAV